MTIDELRSAAAVVRDATEEGENTATRIGQLFLDTVNTLCNVSTNAIKGYVVISSTIDLPTSPTTEQQMKGYLLGTTLYVWVCTGGDTLDGKYQSAQLKGEEGKTGEKGDSGVSLGDVVLVNDLTTGGEGNALSAEMGKVLNEQIEVVSDELSEVGGKVDELEGKMDEVVGGEIIIDFVQGGLSSSTGKPDTPIREDLVTSEYLPSGITLSLKDGYIFHALYTFNSDESFVKMSSVSGSTYKVPVGEQKYKIVVRKPDYSTIRPNFDFLNEIKRKGRIEQIEEELNVLNQQGASLELVTNEDIDSSASNSVYYIEDNSLKLRSIPTTGTDRFMIFNDDILAIEFTIDSLDIWNALELALGYGNSGGNKCWACLTLMSNNSVAGISNILLNIGAAEETNNAEGYGRFSSPYRHPQKLFAKVSVGDKCKIENLLDRYIIGYVIKDNKWSDWFFIDTKGTWNNPVSAVRLGWNVRIGIGFGIRSATESKKVISNIKILSRRGTRLEDEYNYKSKRGLFKKKKWLAIGDSITANDKANGLSYVGFTVRNTMFDCVNIGRSGRTITEFWNNREEYGWENDVTSLGDDDIITILLGTNDWMFNLRSAVPDSSPTRYYRLGNIDASADDARSEETTLGCLRMMLERILELKPLVKVYIFTPFYRTKFDASEQDMIKDGQFVECFLNKEEKTIYEYADAIYSVAKEYNLPAINLCKDSGINYNNLKYYTYDNLHLNQDGGRLIGSIVCKEICL